MTLSRGTRLGPYEVLGLLGAGGMGEVYRARDPRLGREVAVKVLPADHSNDADRLRRFEREARAASALDHPNILAVHDVGIHEKTAYVVSELLEGETLRERLRYGALTSPKAVDYGVQIARGLAAAHAKAIVHRDLKPENLFLTRDGRIKILDFGLAKLTQAEEHAADDERVPTLTQETTPGRVLGTPGYMSPEQVTGRPVDHRSDVFSLGAVLYEMLTGRGAFKRDTDAETMYAILREDLPALSGTDGGVPTSLARVVQRCLEKRPEDRFQSTHDVALTLDVVAGPPDQATAPAGGAARPAGPRLMVPVALAAALAIGLLTGWALWQGGPPEAPGFKQLTFRRGPIYGARFAPDGNTIVYSASWAGGPAELFAGRPESPESRPLGLSGARIASISTSGEMALLLGRGVSATLARAPLAGGAPREVLDDVADADWSPDGGSLVIMRVVNARNRIELPVGKVLHETPYGGIGDIRMSPAGELVAFVEGGGGVKAVAVADRSGKKTTLSGGWVGLNSLAWSPTGEEIWFTTREASGSSALRAVALSGRDRLVARMAGLMVLQDIARDGRILLTRETTRSETRGLLSGDTAERDLSWLDGSEAEDISFDGRVVLLNERAVGGGPGGAVYLLVAGGSAPVRLGEGRGLALSPDGNWIVALSAATPARLVLLPAGAGEPRPIDMHGLRVDSGEAAPVCQWLADGRQILFWGTEPGHTWRHYIMDTAGGRPRPVTPESSYDWDGSRPLSPDGQFVFALQKEGRDAPSKTFAYLHSTEGGRQRRLTAMDGEWRVRWSADGRSLFASPVRERPAKVYRYDLRTERRELWKEISPPDPVGLGSDIKVLPTPDGRFYVYSYRRTLSELYLVEGWR